MPEGVPAFPTLCILSAFAYPVGLAIRELACMLGLVATQPEDLLVDATNQSMSNKRWNATFVNVYQKVSGRGWIWPPASAYKEGLSNLSNDEAGESTSDERTLHNLNAAADSCAIFGPSCLVAGLLLLMRGFGKLDPIALAFAFLALLIGAMLVIACWVTLGRGIAFAVKDVSFKSQIPPRPTPPPGIESQEVADSGLPQPADPTGGVTGPPAEEHTVADSYDAF
jgi:hypothetical protein